MSISDDLAKTWLEHCPWGVLSMDEAGTIRYLNPMLEEMLGVSAGQLLGHTQESLPLPGLSGLFKKCGLMEIAGPGIDQQRWLECNEFSQGPGAMVVRFYQDVTELMALREQKVKLEQKVEDLTITDELTGLANKRALNHALSAQVTRSRRYQNPLSLALVEVRDSSGGNTTLSNDRVLSVSRYLRDRLRWVDVIAHWDHNHFVIILPETNLEQATDLISGISSGFSGVAPGNGDSGQLVMRYGIAQWLKGNDTRILMERAAESLEGCGQEAPVTLVN